MVSRCNLTIKAPDMESIDLQVELEITSMMYTRPGPRAQAPYMIFKVVLNHEAQWAKNGDEHLKFLVYTIWLTLCIYIVPGMAQLE